MLKNLSGKVRAMLIAGIAAVVDVYKRQELWSCFWNSSAKI